MSKNVLYISYDGMTDPLGQSQVIPYLAGLSDKGYAITLLSAEKKDNFEKHHKRIKNLLEKSNIQWQAVNYTKSPPILSTINDISTLKKTAYRLHKTSNFDMVHCRSYIAAFVGQSLKKNLGIKFLFDMRGFWPDERVDGKIWNLSNPLFTIVYRYFKNKEQQFLSQADAVVSLTTAGKTEILKWDKCAIKPDNVSIIPCCADLNHFHYQNIEKQKQAVWKLKLSIPDNHFILNYLGSIGTWYMLDEMLNFYKTCLEINPNTSFLFITKDNPSIILDKVKIMNLPEKQIFITPAERDELPHLLSLCNTSLFFIKPVWSKKASSPTKMAELMGMGIPIVANAGVGDVDEYILQNPNGILVDKFEAKNYQQAANKMFNMHEINKEESRAIAEQHFSLNEGIERYASIYEQLV